MPQSVRHKHIKYVIVYYTVYTLQTTNTCSLWFEASTDYTNDNFIRLLHICRQLYERPIKHLCTTNGIHQTSVIMTLKCVCSSITHTRIRKYCILLCIYFSAWEAIQYLQITIYIIIYSVYSMSDLWSEYNNII